MRFLVALSIAFMFLGSPSCQCQVTPDQIKLGEKCWDQLVKAATSERCLAQCLNANWVGCGMGCGMSLITDAFPDCSRALASLLTKPTGAGPESRDLVCKQEAPVSCFNASETVRAAYEKASKK